MALIRANIESVPKNAKILTRKEALDYQWERIDKWKKRSDIYPITFGSSSLGLSTMFYGFYITNHYRMKLKLRSHGRISMSLPAVIIPALVTGLYHYQGVLPDVLLQETCPVCLQVRGAAYQSILGIVMPTALASTSALLLSTHFATYNIPYITEEPRKLFQLWKNITKPALNKIFYAVAGTALLGMAVTYIEQRSVLKMNESNEL